MKLELARLRHELQRTDLHDEGIEVARNACAGGASIASAAIAAAAYYDSPLVGVQALRACMLSLQSLPCEIGAWLGALQCRHDPVDGAVTYAPGFGYVDSRQAALLISACERYFARPTNQSGIGRCRFFLAHQAVITSQCGPLNRVGLMALVGLDYAVSIEDAERHFMLWHLDSAIREAQRTRQRGLAEFPFLSEYHQYEGPWPNPPQRDEDEYLIQIGLEE